MTQFLLIYFLLLGDQVVHDEYSDAVLSGEIVENFNIEPISDEVARVQHDEILSALSEEFDLNLPVSDLLLPMDIGDVFVAPQATTSNRLTLPIPRKPDCYPAGFSYCGHDSETDDSDELVSDKDNNSSSQSLFLLSKSVSDLNLIGQKREMFVKITQADLDGYSLEFLNCNSDYVCRTVTGMNHSLRFWLCMKLCDLIVQPSSVSKKMLLHAPILTKTKLCEIFGVECSSFFKYRSKFGKVCKTFSDYGGYSPLEFFSTQCRRHIGVLQNLASNFESEYVQNLLSRKM